MTTAKKIRLGSLIFIIALVATIIFQNRELVTTKVLFASIEMPQAFLLFLTFIVGTLAGFVLAYVRINKRLKTVQKSIEKR
jgi:uncharacterized integral membrane protein